MTLALCYMRLGEFQSAQALLKQIILRNPDFADPYFCLGIIYFDQKNNGLAREMLKKALMLNPKKHWVCPIILNSKG